MVHTRTLSSLLYRRQYKKLGLAIPRSRCLSIKSGLRRLTVPQNDEYKLPCSAFRTHASITCYHSALGRQAKLLIVILITELLPSWIHAYNRRMGRATVGYRYMLVLFFARCLHILLLVLRLHFDRVPLPSRPFNTPSTHQGGPVFCRH